MLYALKIAWRYLTANKVQTGLLVAGVAVGVFVFIFISALIGGLGTYLVQRTVGNISHVTISAPDEEMSVLPDSAAEMLVVRQANRADREILRNAEAFIPLLEGLTSVAAVSPQIVGNGFAVRGQLRAPVAVTGVAPDKVSAIADLDSALVAGNTLLTNASVVIGASLAEDLNIGVGQVLRLQSDRGMERPLVVAGIFAIGVEALDARSAFVSTATARFLFEIEQGLSRMEIKLDDLNAADTIARRIAGITGLEAIPWTAGNSQLLEGLRAQSSSGDLIKAFALITIVIGVASALLLSTYRRRPEIGIMRAMGASQLFVVAVFVIQGALIGILGACIGAGLGYLALSPFPVPENAAPGGLPVDVRQGAFGLAIVLTAIGAVLASILPARSAARVDPVSVIGQ